SQFPGAPFGCGQGIWVAVTFVRPLPSGFVTEMPEYCRNGYCHEPSYLKLAKAILPSPLGAAVWAVAAAVRPASVRARTTACRMYSLLFLIKTSRSSRSLSCAIHVRQKTPHVY